MPKGKKGGKKGKGPRGSTDEVGDEVGPEGSFQSAGSRKWKLKPMEDVAIQKLQDLRGFGRSDSAENIRGDTELFDPEAQLQRDKQESAGTTSADAEAAAEVGAQGGRKGKKKLKSLATNIGKLAAALDPSKEKKKKKAKLPPLKHAGSKAKRNLKGLAASVGSVAVAFGGGSSGNQDSALDAVCKALLRKQGEWLPALKEEEIYQLAPKVEVVSFAKGDSVFEQGTSGEEAMALWVLLDGYVMGVQKREGQPKEKLFSSRKFGTTYGDQSFLGGCDRPHSLVAKTKAVLGKIKKSDYIHLLDDDPAKVELVRVIPMSFATKAMRMRKGLLLELLSHAEVLALAEKSNMLWYHPSDVVVNQGDSVEKYGSWVQQLYLLESGVVDVGVLVVDPLTGHKYLKHVASLDQPGTLFGEMSLLFGTKRTATVTAATESRICAIPKDAFDPILAQRPDVLNQFMDLLGIRKKDTQNQTAGLTVVHTEDSSEDLDENGVSRTRSRMSAEEDEFQRTKSEEEQIAEMEEQARNFRYQQRKRAALDFLNAGEDSLTNVLNLFDQVAKSGDWDQHHDELISMIDDAIEKFEVLDTKFEDMLPLQEMSKGKIEKRLAELDHLRAQAEAFLPASEMKDENTLRHDFHKRLHATPKQYAKVAQSTHLASIDWHSMKEVCHFLESTPEIIQNNLNGITRFKELLDKKYGGEVGHQLHNDIYLWYERKQEAWQTLHNLEHQNTVHEEKLTALQSKCGGDMSKLQEYERNKFMALSDSKEEGQAIKRKIYLDLESMNKAIIKSCFMNVPPPPASCLRESPILAFTLHMQRILELKEDHRMAKKIGTQHANAVVGNCIRDASVGISKAMDKNITLETWIPVNEDGSREVAPIMQGFMSELGSWLFSVETDRWERAARKIAAIQDAEQRTLG